MQKITDFNVSKNKGIYCIINIINNKKYIGSAVNLHERLTQHFSELSRGIHFNNHLQQSFKKYGKESFFIDVIEEFEKIDYKALLVLEDYYILKYNCLNPKIGYNKRTNDTFPELSESSKSKRKEKHDKYKIKVKCFVAKTGEFYKDFESISDCAKDLNDQTTNICFALNNLSRSVKGYVIIKKDDYNPDACYKYIPYKRVYTEELIKYKQKHNSKNKKVYVWTKDNVIEYFSISEANRQLGLKKYSLSHIMKKHGGIKYKEYYITLNKDENYSQYDSAWNYEPGVIKNQFSK